jgi:hypothetical protein
MDSLFPDELRDSLFPAELGDWAFDEDPDLETPPVRGGSMGVKLLKLPSTWPLVLTSGCDVRAESGTVGTPDIGVESLPLQKLRNCENVGLT